MKCRDGSKNVNIVGGNIANNDCKEMIKSAPTPDSMSELDTAEKELEILINAFSHLMDRCSHFLTPYPQQDTVDDTPNMPASPIVNRIRSLTKRLLYLREELEKLSARIQ